MDVTGSIGLFGDGMRIAEEIRQRVKHELGVTVSIGVSWNTIFAKLVSDLRKPDAITRIERESFRENIWPLPASDLLYVGPATTRKLAGVGVHTIGELARSCPLTFCTHGSASGAKPSGPLQTAVASRRWQRWTFLLSSKASATA